jgi:hypothetical protein
MDMKIDLPQIFILSTQRSGTHLLESFLLSHPQINNRGEIFDTLQKKRIPLPNKKGRFNIGILMYNQIPIFQASGGHFENHKIIHLTRNPAHVALSQLQAVADKKLHGTIYRAHTLKHQPPQKKGTPDMSTFGELAHKISLEQRKHTDLLKTINHLPLNYEDFVSNNQNVEFLNEDVQRRILKYLNLKDVSYRLFTSYIKTGTG